jgi:hypothetical protein
MVQQEKDKEKRKPVIREIIIIIIIMIIIIIITTTENSTCKNIATFFLFSLFVTFMAGLALLISFKCVFLFI